MGDANGDRALRLRAHRQTHQQGQAQQQVAPGKARTQYAR